MTAIAPSPPPPLPPPQIQLPGISFFGRSLAEYERFFALDAAALRGRDVLDVAAGPSSFTAEACARRIDAVAIDPLYDRSAEELTGRVAGDYAHMFGQIRAHRRMIRLGGRGNARPRFPRPLNAAPAPVFRSLGEAEADRRSAAERFLADYAAYRLHGRYVCGGLPRLPFFDATFDLVLCAHLLFTYATRFTFDWHVAACRELVRVSAGEVRLHPLCGLDGKPYPGLARLRRELKALDIASEVVAVDYAFFSGANSMLVLRRKAA